MPIKVQLTADNKPALASIDELERRLRRVSASAADMFAKVGASAKMSILQQYGIPTAANVETHVLQSDRLMAQGARQLARLGSLIQQQNATGALARQINVGLGIGAQRYRPDRAAYEAFWRASVPTAGVLQSEKFLGGGARSLMQMGTLSSGFNQKQAAIGAVSSLFSPWVGARMLNQAFGGFPGITGGGGGGGGGITKAIFGAGGIPGFGEWYIFINALRIASRVLTEEFTAAIRRGSALYQQSAMTATSPGRLSHLQAMLGSIGISPDSVNRMMLQSQTGRGGRFTSVDNILMRARTGGMGQGEIQQIINMRQELELWDVAMKKTDEAIGESAQAMQRMHMLSSAVKQEWNLFWSELTKVMEPWIDTMLSMGLIILKQAQMGLQLLRNTLIYGTLGPIIGKGADELLKRLFPSGKPGDTFVGPSQSVSRPESAWEKMGLIVNGGLGGRDYARQTAENTKKIADHIFKLFPANSSAAMGGMQPGFNLP